MTVDFIEGRVGTGLARAACAGGKILSSASLEHGHEADAVRKPMSQRAALQVLGLALVYAFPAFLVALFPAVGDPDIWWHMRTGQWIMQHGFPHTDPFSSYAAGKPWSAYSWLFDLLVFKLYSWLGLKSVAVYTAGMLMAITVALHRLNRRLLSDFKTAAWLTLAGIFCTAPIWTPRSWMFSILFFIIELDVLMQARRTGKTLELWCLPVLFALWANLHIQFIDGLVVLGIAVLEAGFALWWNRSRGAVGLGTLCGVSVACAGAALINPYGWNIYTTAYGLASQQGVLNTLNELLAMSFRNVYDYGVVFFALGAAAALARARRRQMFEFVLLIFAVVVAFRSQRDAWIMITVASGIMAAQLGEEGKEQARPKVLVVPAASIGAAALAVLFFAVFHVNDNRLAAKQATTLPVRAADFVKANHLKGPLFNTYSWGGYLMWNPGLPVSIDGRAELVGDKLLARSAATWAGAPDWACDPVLQNANVVFGPVSAPLTQLLRLNSHFRLAYEDKLAAVFVARQPSSGVAAPPLPCGSSSPAAAPK